jgi:hypothetical protein
MLAELASKSRLGVAREAHGVATLETAAQDSYERLGRLGIAPRGFDVDRRLQRLRDILKPAQGYLLGRHQR